MRKTDSNQIALLATLILSDLLDETKDDLFVISFNSQYQSAKDTTPHRLSRRSSYYPDPSNIKFKQSLKNIASYDAKCTYFAPAIDAALKELEKSNGSYGEQILIFLTDGESNDEEQAKDKGCHNSKGIDEKSEFDTKIKPLAINLMDSTNSKGLFKGVFPLALSPSPKINLSSNLLLNLYDQNSIGAPVIAISEAREIAYQFAKILEKVASRKVQPILNLSSDIQNLTTATLKTGKTGQDFHADPALSRMDVVSISSKNPLLSTDIDLFEPHNSTTPYSVIDPANNDIANTILSSYQSNGKPIQNIKQSVESGYSIKRIRSLGIGQATSIGDWNISKSSKPSTKNMKIYSFIVFYYDFKVSFNSHSSRTSIPLDLPICYNSQVTDRQPTPVLLSALASGGKINGKDPLTLNLNSTFQDHLSSNKKPMNVLKYLSDDGTQVDVTPYDADFNACATYTANLLGIGDVSNYKNQEYVGEVLSTATLFYAGNPSEKSPPFALKILPPMIIRPNQSILQFLGADSAGLKKREEQCQHFIFQTPNAFIPEGVQGKEYNQFLLKAENIDINSSFANNIIKLCEELTEDQSACKTLKAMIYQKKAKIYETRTSLSHDKDYYLCVTAGTRLKADTSPNPKSFAPSPSASPTSSISTATSVSTSIPASLPLVPQPIKITITPLHKDYKDDHPFPQPTPPTPEKFPYGKKWSISGEIFLEIKLSDPSFWDLYGGIVSLFVILLIALAMYLRSIRKNRINSLAYAIWKGSINQEALRWQNIPYQNQSEISDLGLTLTAFDMRNESDEEVVYCSIKEGLTIERRSVDPYMWIKLQANEKGNFTLAIGVTYRLTNDVNHHNHGYFFKFKNTHKEK